MPASTTEKHQLSAADEKRAAAAVAFIRGKDARAMALRFARSYLKFINGAQAWNPGVHKYEGLTNDNAKRIRAALHGLSAAPKTKAAPEPATQKAGAVTRKPTAKRTRANRM